MSRDIIEPVGPESPILQFCHGDSIIAYMPLFLIKKIIDKKGIDLSGDQEVDWFHFTGRSVPSDPAYAAKFLMDLKNTLSWEEINNLIQPIIRPLDHLKELWEKAGNSENLYSCKFGILKTPSTLYRYCTYVQERIYEIFCENKIYLTSPRGFRDPFDCNFNDQVRLNLDQAGIACFSQIKDSVLMFSHYADRHNGICLIFAPYKMYNLTAPDGQKHRSQFRPVYYFEKLPEFDLKSEIALIATCKDIAWAYEREWRMFIEDGNGSVLGPGHYEFPPESLKGVIFGAEMPLENKTEIRKITKGRNKFSYLQAIRIPDKFGIAFETVEYVL